MRLSPEDQHRLWRAIQLTERLQANFHRENETTVETRPKRGGHAFRKRRSLK